MHAVHMVPCEGRLIQLWMYYRNGSPDDNHYAHPLDFIPVVDLNLKKVSCKQESYMALGCCLCFWLLLLSLWMLYVNSSL